MTDANLVRVMQAQTKRKVGLIDYKTVAQGEVAIRERIAALRAEGVAVAVVDATSNDDPAPAWACLEGHAAGHCRLGRGDWPACQLWPPAFSASQPIACSQGLASGGLWQLLGGHQRTSGALQNDRAALRWRSTLRR